MQTLREALLAYSPQTPHAITDLNNRVLPLVTSIPR
jgi:hypothetical protein